jgi:CheY-like chemotaxis protein
MACRAATLGIQGTEAAEALRASPSNRQIPAIAHIRTRIPGGRQAHVHLKSIDSTLELFFYRIVDECRLLA